jgi:hypothetical protein
MAFYSPETVVRLLRYDFNKTADVIVTKYGYMGSVTDIILPLSAEHMDLALGIVRYMKDNAPSRESEEMFRRFAYAAADQGLLDARTKRADALRRAMNDSFEKEWIQRNDKAALQDVIAVENDRLRSILGRDDVFSTRPQTDVNHIILGGIHERLYRWHARLHGLAGESSAELLNKHRLARDTMYKEAALMADSFERAEELEVLARHFIAGGSHTRAWELYQSGMRKNLHIYDRKGNDLPFWWGRASYRAWKERGDQEALVMASIYYQQLLSAGYPLQADGMEEVFSKTLNDFDDLKTIFEPVNQAREPLDAGLQPGRA